MDKGLFGLIIGAVGTFLSIILLSIKRSNRKQKERKKRAHDLHEQFKEAIEKGDPTGVTGGFDDIHRM
jgi:preprotein translocase subunit YajC